MNTNNQKIYLPGLNGLRAIAAIAVVMSHTALAIDKFELNLHIFGSNANGKPKALLLASHGVTLFFVLSGFLITYLLILEKNKGEIDIRKFYMRRILRIWPAYYSYLILAVITAIVFAEDIDLGALSYYIFFGANIPFIFNFALPFLDHYWSIAVEEQFYLFWPWVIKKIKKNIFKIIIGYIIIHFIIRVIVWYLFPFTPLAIFTMVNRFDCMVFGALGAFLYERKNKLFLLVFDNKITQFVSLLILFALALNFSFVNAVIDTSIVSIVALALIIGQINVKNRILNLENALCNFLGKISYGIYVYHPLLIFLISLLFKEIFLENDILKLVLVYLSILSATILLSYISYNYFEKRFIRYKDKFAIIKSSSSK